jgi:signal transduction histidine kinase
VQHRDASLPARLMTNISLQLINERMLLGALREQDAAAAAEVARQRAEFLADASLRFGASLDQELTYAAIAEVALPGPGAWCIVDVIEVGGGLRRLAIVHPDESKQDAVRTLASHWTPAAEDPIGVPAIMRDRKPVIVVDRAEAAVAAAARDPETLRALRSLGPGDLLVVPIIAHGELLGAITFVNRPGAPPPTPEDIQFGEAIAARCAQALESARLYAAARASRAEAEAARAEADAARAVAEAANETKAHFLNTMSHELRTPLNAIGGYAQLLEMGVHGPITPEQRTDLASIQRSQAHLLGLVDAVLNYAQLGAGRVVYATVNIPLIEVVQSVEIFIVPQMRAKKIQYTFESCPQPLIVCADAAKVRQIVLNLIGNAIKFTAAGGHVAVTCDDEVPVPVTGPAAGRHMLAVHVVDNGMGIPASKIEGIFDPFVQVDRQLTSQQGGVGLGLAISRDLARGMGGDITVDSMPNVGSTFTLLLPAA